MYYWDRRYSLFVRTSISSCFLSFFSWRWDGLYNSVMHVYNILNPIFWGYNVHLDENNLFWEALRGLHWVAIYLYILSSLVNQVYLFWGKNLIYISQQLWHRELNIHVVELLNKGEKTSVCAVRLVRIY